MMFSINLIIVLKFPYFHVELQTFYLPWASTNDTTNFKVRCDGACSAVKVTLFPSDGDPDLYGMKDHKPCPGDYGSGCDCTSCANFCYSVGTSGKDVCDNLISESSSFYITVYAFEEYTSATVLFENIKSIDEIGRQTSFPKKIVMIHNTLYFIRFKIILNTSTAYVRLLEKGFT